MKNLFTAVVLGIALVGLSYAQAASKGSAERAGKLAKTRLAVIEFSPGPNASGMTVEDKRQLQSSLAFSLFSSGKFDVVDVKNTRAASQGDLAAINGDASTAAAVKIGKQLGVSHVMTGTVIDYSTKGTATLKTRLIEVTTGKVRYSGESTQKSTSEMTARAGTAEMMLKVMKPWIEKLTTAVTGVEL